MAEAPAIHVDLSLALRASRSRGTSLFLAVMVAILPRHDRREPGQLPGSAPTGTGSTRFEPFADVPAHAYETA